MANATPVAQAVTVFPLEALLFGLVLIVLAVLVLKFLKNFLINSVLGVAALLVIQILADAANYPAIKVPITAVTVILSGIFGLAGVGLLIILKLLGIIIQ